MQGEYSATSSSSDQVQIGLEPDESASSKILEKSPLSSSESPSILQVTEAGFTSSSTEPVITVVWFVEKPFSKSNPTRATSSESSALTVVKVDDHVATSSKTTIVLANFIVFGRTHPVMNIMLR